MTINLANDYNNDFGRSFPITGTDFIFEGDECFAQTSTGIVYEHKGKEYEAPFTIYCLSKMIYCLFNFQKYLKMMWLPM